MSKPTVTPIKGQVIALSPNNPEFGYIRVEQNRTIISDDGFVKNKKIAALLLGTVAELRKTGYQAGQELEGRVIVKEQLTAFNKKDLEKDIKVAGDTKVVCMVGDAPIYRKAFFSQDPNAQDQLMPAIYKTADGKMVSHTNSEAIKAAYAKSLETAGADLSLD